MEQFLDALDGLPTVVIYLVLGFGAAIENFIPILPADTFIVAGGFAAGVGRVGPVPVFFTTWAFNVAGAMVVYWVGLRYGIRFFRAGPGRHFLSMHQLGTLQAFYARWGVPAIFVARFLPGLRALVPVFAGVTRQHPARVLPPIILASALWYGGLVRLGFVTGDNLETVLQTLSRANQWFLGFSVVAFFALAALWHRSRRPPGGRGKPEGGAGD